MTGYGELEVEEEEARESWDGVGEGWDGGVTEVGSESEHRVREDEDGGRGKSRIVSERRREKRADGESATLSCWHFAASSWKAIGKSGISRMSGKLAAPYDRDGMSGEGRGRRFGVDIGARTSSSETSRSSTSDTGGRSAEGGDRRRRVCARRLSTVLGGALGV